MDFFAKFDVNSDFLQGKFKMFMMDGKSLQLIFFICYSYYLYGTLPLSHKPKA